MMQFAEAFAWCMLQVTVFTFVVACLYLVAARSRWGGGASLLVSGLYIVGLLTLLCVSPWPRWSSLDLDNANSATSIASGDVGLRRAEALSNRALSENAPASTERMLEQTSPLTSIKKFALDFPAAEAASPGSVRAIAWWIFAVGVAWVAAAIGLIRFLVAMATLWRLRSSSVAIEESALLSLLDELSREIRIKRPVRLRESPTLGVAATCGWWKPVILLPTAWRQWTADERRAVLAHELAHIREGHFPKWLCGQLAVVAHFYHPIVHWLVRRLRFEQELAADRLAARVFGNRARYASALAALALGAAPPSGAVASLGLFMSKPFLMRRLAMLRELSDSDRRRSRLKRGLIFMLVALAGLAAAGLRAEQPAQSNEHTLVPISASGDAAQLIGITATQPTGLEVVTPSGDAAPLMILTPQSATTTTPAPEAYVTALFRVSHEPGRVLGDSSTQSDAAWEIFCKTQIALLKSYLVLQSAVRDPKIAALPMLASAEDPVGFLAQRLEVGFYPGSEILYVRMGLSRTDKATQAKQAVQIVDAVAKAYEEEVIFKDKQRQRNTTDLLARSLKKLQDEIRQRWEDYLDIAQSAGLAESGAGQVAQQLDIRRLERIEDELMRLENDLVELQTSGKEGNVKFFEQRIAQLSKRQEELEQRIIGRSEPSAELSERRRELEQFQRVANDMSAKLGLAEIEANAPNRIERIQGAVITSGSQSQAVPAK